MKILNFGSLNVDHVYAVDHFVRPGETLDSIRYSRFCGGKGLNQSIALAHAGAKVYHAGKVGPEGVWLKDRLKKEGVNTAWVTVTDGSSGHAIIQVNREGENSIILHGGANRAITPRDADRVLGEFSAGDYLLLQNEISSIPQIMKRAARMGLRIVLNPTPMTPDVVKYPLDLVSCFILNEIEGEGLTGKKEPGRILTAMMKQYPEAAVVVTLGARGVLYGEGGLTLSVPAVKVKPVDTTAAGDTFIGFFLADMAAGRGVETALQTACRAAAICVTRHGAADSIPRRSEL